MDIVFKKTLRGFLFGLAGGAVIYLVSFVIELCTFIKFYISNTNMSDSVMNGTSSEVTIGHAFALYQQQLLLPVWSWEMVFLLVGCACVLGTIIGAIIGFLTRSDRADKVNKYNMSVLEDGSQRQKTIFANSIKTMADSLTKSCDETLYYMNNLVSTQYISCPKDEDIMTELVKFIEYEQAIGDFIKDNTEEGGC